MLNMKRAVLMLARVEIGNLNGRWHQGAWALLNSQGFTPAMDSEGHVLVDEHGEPIGVGVCNTAYCAAGWALHDSLEDGDTIQWTSTGSGNYYQADMVRDGRAVSDAALEYLGIEPPRDRIALGYYDDELEDNPDRSFRDSRWNYEQDMPHLFDADNSIEDLYHRVLEYADHLDIDIDDLHQRVEDQMLLLQKEAVSH